ncbi:hypothetical protein DMUE_0739 [Dictyocoela muelleri]|nr:hypothetical protein DMUE_0739 [Dictyocoela muelleri]
MEQPFTTKNNLQQIKTYLMNNKYSLLNQKALRQDILNINKKFKIKVKDNDEYEMYETSNNEKSDTFNIDTTNIDTTKDTFNMGAFNTDNINTDTFNNDNINTDNINTDNIDTDNINNDTFNTDNINTDSFNNDTFNNIFNNSENDQNYVFFGEITLKEIILFLKLNEYSLLNKKELKNELLNYKRNFRAENTIDSETNKPEENKLEINKSEGNKMVMNKPEKNKLEINKSEENKMVINKPEENKSEINKSEENKMVINKPEENKSEINKSEENKLVINKPEENKLVKKKMFTIMKFNFTNNESINEEFNLDDIILEKNSYTKNTEYYDLALPHDNNSTPDPKLNSTPDFKLNSLPDSKLKTKPDSKLKPTNDFKLNLSPDSKLNSPPNLSKKQPGSPLKRILEEIEELTPNNSPVKKLKHNYKNENSNHNKEVAIIDFTNSYFINKSFNTRSSNDKKFNDENSSLLSDSQVNNKVKRNKRETVLTDKSNLKVLRQELEKIRSNYSENQEIIIKPYEIKDQVLRNIIFNTGKEFRYPGKVVFRKRDEKKEKQRRKILEALTLKNTKKNGNYKYYRFNKRGKRKYYLFDNNTLESSRSTNRVSFSDKKVFFFYESHNDMNKNA